MNHAQYFAPSQNSFDAYARLQRIDDYPNQPPIIDFPMTELERVEMDSLVAYANDEMHRLETQNTPYSEPYDQPRLYSTHDWQPSNLNETGLQQVFQQVIQPPAAEDCQSIVIILQISARDWPRFARAIPYRR